MTNFIVEKQEITRKVLELLSDSSDAEKEYESALKSWWRNLRTNGGLRLTTEGLLAFRLANLQEYSIPWGEDFHTSISLLMLRLQEHLLCPYYLDIDKNSENITIIVFDGRMATTMILYGSVSAYLKSKIGEEHGK